MSKALVVYYSYSGNTRKIAETIAGSVGADIIEIRAQGEKKGRSLIGKIFQELGKILTKKDTKILPINRSLEDYSLIFLGSPIWGGDLANPVRTFLRHQKMQGKKIGFFYSCGGDDPKAREKITGNVKPTLSKDNTLVSVIGFSKTIKKFNQQKGEIIDWAKKVRKDTLCT